MAEQDLQEIVRTIESSVTQTGEKLITLCAGSPVLLVFLRHAGCPFCREAVADIARSRRAIEETGTRLVLVHMRDSEAIGRLLGKHGLLDVDRICDPEQKLHRVFGVRRGKLWQLLGPFVLWRGVRAAILAGHGIGAASADTFQLGGLFLIRDGEIVRRFRHRTSADRPDYAAICRTLAKAGAAR